MRRIWFLAAILMVSLLSIQSCSSDDDDKNPLVGTKWVSESFMTDLYSILHGKRMWHVREFTSKTKYSEYFEDPLTGMRGSSGYFKDKRYEYHDSYVTFFNSDGAPVDWYFLSPTEMCNKRDKGESNAVVYKKQ